MAWENVMIGYNIAFLKECDIIPIGSIFLFRIVREDAYDGTIQYIRYAFQIPIYKKMNKKKD